MDACINMGAVQHQGVEWTSDVFKHPLLTSVENLTSFCEFCCSRNQENTIYKNNLYCSNLTFSGVLRGTQGGHVEKCVNL